METAQESAEKSEERYLEEALQAEELRFQMTTGKVCDDMQLLLKRAEKRAVGKKHLDSVRAFFQDNPQSVIPNKAVYGFAVAAFFGSLSAGTEPLTALGLSGATTAVIMGGAKAYEALLKYLSERS
jgi:hypothetical protein